MREFDVLVIGAGAAGLMCAIEAGRRGRRVLVLDHAEKVGKKILISGGGRCNFTNLGTRPENFLSLNPHFAKSALAAYRPEDFIGLVEKHGVAYHEKTLGQLFCDGSSREIVALLEAECAEAGVVIWLSTQVMGIVAGRGSRTTGFTVRTSDGDVWAESVVVATGGLSIPKMGATGFGYEVARQFGMGVVVPRPGLVPFTLRAEDRDAWCDLSGVSAMVSAGMERTAGQRKSAPEFREKLLVTHRGVSGPAVLQISSYWDEGAAETVVIDLAPGLEVFAPLLAAGGRRDPAAALASLRAVLPGRWAERWMQRALPVDAPRQLGNALIADLERQVHGWRVTPGGTEGYEKAEVTVGGVDTAELDARTMEARRVPGLYFVGEVVDVTGWLGGYNFQWAWASGAAAGRAA